MINSFLDLSIATIEKALVIRKQIEVLQESLVKIIGGTGLAASFAEPAPAAAGAKSAKGRRTMSVAGRARVAAAQRARWAKTRAASASAASAAKAPRKKRTMSLEARARIAAAQRARWAKQKAA